MIIKQNKNLKERSKVGVFETQTAKFFREKHSYFSLFLVIFLYFFFYFRNTDHSIYEGDCVLDRVTTTSLPAGGVPREAPLNPAVALPQYCYSTRGNFILKKRHALKKREIIQLFNYLFFSHT